MSLLPARLRRLPWFTTSYFQARLLLARSQEFFAKLDSELPPGGRSMRPLLEDMSDEGAAFTMDAQAHQVDREYPA